MTRSVETRYTISVLALAALCAATACGKSGLGSPVAASAPGPSSPAPSSTGATITGQVNIGAGSASRSRDVASGLIVRIVGANVSAAVSNGRFELDNSPAGHVELQFEGQGVNARVDVGDVAEHERVELQITLNGSTGSLDASRHVSSDDQAEIKGRIASIDSASRSLQVGTSSVLVPESASIRSGSAQVAFSALKVGLLVEIHGSMQGSAVNAQDVNVEDALGGDDGGAALETEFTGLVTAVGGSCPKITLTVAGKTVTTSEATEFPKAACGDITLGATVQVKGTAQADGSIAASRVQSEDSGSGGGSGK